ncbi:endo-1,5-alpha-L-arabinosidase [Polyplosphaeria fusca]|uniref:Arabinan endo-1,5-alpha-L-arabinosidase n=1 Tax=Polyplosphaeria fusca TaxID=682080 RepID=A0A9P4UXI6_9PLEO|nr:endo-1,5-alpha-L-arabinosidase [Polyplosphaeria fusca]
MPQSATTFPNPEPCTGNCSWIHDPSVIRKDELYYRFSTSGNIAIATAPKLSGPWEYKGPLLDNGTSIHVIDGQDVWAPDVSKVGELYYAFYAVSHMGLQNSSIGVATSQTLEPGSWTDHGSIGLPLSQDYNLIDPNVLVDGDAVIFSFGSYWDDIFQIQVSANGLIEGLVDAGPADNIINNRSSTLTVAEGSFQFKWDNFYFVFFSVGWCCNEPPNLALKGEEYRIMACRSDNAAGPFVDSDGKSCLDDNGGTLVLGSHDDVYAPGGQGAMVEYESGHPVLYYHYVKPSVGYAAHQFFFGYNYLDFSTGWPIVV